MKTCRLFIFGLFLFLAGLSAHGRIDISLAPSDWTEHGTVTSPRTLTQTAEGYLRATCNAWRGHVNYRTKDTYNFQGAVVRYKWRVNCGGNYCWTQDGCYPWGRMAAYNLTTHHSWASSIVISTNTWIYTEILFNENRTWSINYSYSGYGAGGITVNSGTISDVNWDLLANSFAHKLVGDGYANSFYYEIAEAYYIPPEKDLSVDISHPADGAGFTPDELIHFEAFADGGTEPYEFEWKSDIDGTLGTAQTLAIDLLTEGEHTISVTCTDNSDKIRFASITIYVTQLPVIMPIADHHIADNSSYHSPVPVLTQGNVSVTWSLIEGAVGMTVNPKTGSVSWPQPVGASEPYTITIQADNPLGSDQASWQLTVLSLPQIQTLSTQIAVESRPFVSEPPILLKGSPPVEWAMVSGPAQMTIDTAAGVVSWENPVPSFSAYPVTLRATNAIGSDTTSFSVWVHSVPQIAAMTDRQIILGQPYNLNPVLIKGVPAAEWSLDAAPPQMSINATTGAISWADPGPEDSTHSVTVRAANTMGSHTQSFTIRVMLPPVLADLDHQTVHEGQSFSQQISLIQGTGPVVYTVISGPLGMSIDANGQLTLPYANGNYSPYTVTLRAANAVGADQNTFILTVLRAPLIRPIAEALTAEHAPYAAAAPGLFQGSPPVEWSLVAAPAGMTVDPATGAVSWPSATYAGSPHTVTLKAENVVGSHTQSWPITVVQPPVIAAYGDKLAGNATSYIAPLPTLMQGTHVTWSLAEAPAGMTIQAATGQIVWPSPVASDVPHTITLQAQNCAGSDTETFALTIHSKPVLADASDVQMVENRPYAGPAAQLLAGQAPVTFALTQGPTGMTIDAATGAISWPVPTAVGSPHRVQVRASNTYGTDEKTFKAVVPIGYAAETWTDIELAPAGSPIPIVGQAYDLADGTPTANVTVYLHVRLKNTVRVFKLMTDAEGQFAFTFTPVGNEAGLYGISAGHPLAVPQEAQDNFTLVALTASDSVQRPRLTEGEWYETTVSLNNPGDTTLTQIEAVKVGGTETIEMEFEPLAVIAGGATETAALRLRAVDASVRLSVVDVQFVSDQGATASLAYTTRVIPLSIDVKVLPAALEAGMVRGQQQAVSFEVANEGGLATPELSVLIPDAPWLSMATPVVIGVLQPGDIAEVTLLLTPDESLTLGPYQGSLYVHGTGMTRTVPFTFNCVSDRIGRLDVKAVDEFTYYAQGAPLVSDARLTLRDAFSREALFVNEPMPDGRWLLDDIAEGYYILELAAPEHSGYRSTLYAASGVTTTITAFMSRELVKYTWTVTPTAIQDVYTVTLNTTFETNVPAPVVVVEPANVDLSAMVDGRMQVDFTVTNHGLIAAEDVHLVFDNHPRYRVELLTDFNGQVAPGQTVVIPAMVTDNNLQPMPIMSDVQLLGDDTLMPFGGNCDPVRGGTYYTPTCAARTENGRKSPFGWPTGPAICSMSFAASSAPATAATTPNATMKTTIRPKHSGPDRAEAEAAWRCRLLPARPERRVLSAIRRICL